MIGLATPAATFETGRLYLRPLEERDAAHFERLFRDDWDAVKQTGRLPFPTTAVAMRAWIVRHTGPGGHAFFLRRKPDRDPVGAIGFGGDGPIAEIGYAIGRIYWGQGYATEAVGAMIGFAREVGLSGLQAYSFVENPASAKVLEKAGFSEIGVIVREYPKRGGMRRVHHFKKMF
ncbi:MAG: GNAT family N-acetyltransferase [Geminicoccaceae bacterium]